MVISIFCLSAEGLPEVGLSAGGLPEAGLSEDFFCADTVCQLPIANSKLIKKINRFMFFVVLVFVLSFLDTIHVPDSALFEPEIQAFRSEQFHTFSEK